MGLGFIGLAGWSHENWSIFSLNFLAISGGLTAISDLRALTWVTRLGFPVKNDADDMAHLVGCPALFWAVLWFLMALVILGAATWLTWFSEWQ